MKRVALLIVVVFSVLALVGCGGGGGGGSSSGTGGGTPITESQGQQAASVSGQAAALASGSSETFSSLVRGLSNIVGSPVPALKFSKGFKKDAGLAITSELAGKFVRSQAVQSAVSAVRKAVSEKTTTTVSGSGTCQDGGSYSYSGTYDDVTGNLDLTFTFNNCREGSEQFNGTYHLSGTYANNSFNFQITFGSSNESFTIYAYDSTNTLVYSMTANITLGVSGDSSSTTITANGNITATDILSGDTYTLTYINFTATDTNNNSTTTITTNGTVEESWQVSGTSYSVKVTFTNFNLQNVDYGTYDDTTISGTVTIDFTPDECFEGTFIFVTNIPIRWDDNVGHRTQGQVTVNGNTVITWNSDGSVTVTVNGTQVYTGPEADLYDTCGFATMDPDTQTTSGGTGGTASGNQMTITLTWSGNDYDDMDLHVNYYNTTTPTSTTPGTAYVDWHGMDNVTCPSNYHSCADLDGDGVADMGLDIDDTDGYGPEHIYATSLPAGYYVVSVNSYYLAGSTSTEVSVSIQIGNYSFGPYTYTFTVDDSEGTDPNAWFAVADIVVDGSGNVTVQAHDPNLELWHTGNFGMVKPLGAKKLR